jgi:NAD(P)-dependent dehydrogenase (short-subunit alcohol dehydrogenase family)
MSDQAIRRPTVFITGAAGGIGLAAALRFHAAGWRVLAADRDAAGLQALQRLTSADRLVTVCCDVTSSAEVTAAFECLKERFGPALDVLVNNAGVLHVGRFEELDAAEHDQTIRVNVNGVLAVLHAAFPFLKAARGARVVNMSSASAVFGVPEFASYSASKFFVRGLTEALAVEWRAHEIHVCHVMPAFVATGMVEDQHADSMDRLGVRLTAEQVAEVVFRAATRRKRLSWPVGGGFRVLRIILGPAPEWLKKRIMGWITGY